MTSYFMWRVEYGFRRVDIDLFVMPTYSGMARSQSSYTEGFMLSNPRQSVRICMSICRPLAGIDQLDS